MTLKEILQKIVKGYKKDYDEIAEEEEFEKYLLKVEGRMNKIQAAQKAENHKDRAEIALMVENAYTQKKIIEANQSLKDATWILAIATGIFAYVAVIDSINSNSIISNLKTLGGVILLIILIGLVFNILIKVIKFIFKLIKKARYG